MTPPTNIPTPRTDEALKQITEGPYVNADFARQLERELTQWREDAERLAEQLELRCKCESNTTDVLNVLTAHNKLMEQMKEKV